MTPAATDPVLQILVRTDLSTLNPGKAMAHAAHAANLAQCVLTDPATPARWRRLWTAWAREGGGFGTTLALGAGEEEIRALVAEVEADRSGKGGVVVDPTYPLPWRGRFHLVPMLTCGWLFGPRGALKAHTGHLLLHP